MTSRTMSAVVHITVCLFVFCNINVMTTEVTPTQDHSKMLVTTEDFQANTTTYSEQTTLSPALDVINSSYSNTSTSSTNTPELSPSPSSTPAATTQITINVSGPSAMSTSATSALLPSTPLPFTGSSGSIDNTTRIKATSTQTKAITSILSTQKDPTPQTSATETTPKATDTTALLSDTDKQSLKYSEIILTSIFSTILVVVVLVIIAYNFKKCLRPSSQYSHHPLRETSFDSDQYCPPDDTLVISGGLYDAPRIYNPNMTVLEEEESQNDLASFNSRPGQLRLEFLPGDKDLDPSFNRSLRRNV